MCLSNMWISDFECQQGNLHIELDDDGGGVGDGEDEVTEGGGGDKILGRLLVSRWGSHKPGASLIISMVSPRYEALHHVTAINTVN